MIVDETPCSPEDLKSLYFYLMGTPVAQSVKVMFNSGNVKAYPAQIINLNELGEKYLIWSNLGGFIQRPKYKVKEAYTFLEKAKNHDAQSMYNWNTVNDYIELLSTKRIELKITSTKALLGTSLIDIIIDGCKRTTAFYEYHKRLKSQSIDFRFFILK